MRERRRASLRYYAVGRAIPGAQSKRIGPPDRTGSGSIRFSAGPHRDHARDSTEQDDCDQDPDERRDSATVIASGIAGGNRRIRYLGNRLVGQLSVHGRAIALAVALAFLARWGLTGTLTARVVATLIALGRLFGGVAGRSRRVAGRATLGSLLAIRAFVGAVVRLLGTVAGRTPVLFLVLTGYGIGGCETRDRKCS